ncbi:hypothetical protein FNI45_20245, partial [Salmonella enterica subsp. salamae]|nr:hypothetical protein [Salmonella enterica subsp. salamae]ECC1657660.1 hypothetical protein [Salmonella enterica subsp. salamae]ECF5931254.1 hypothetical protein [Salmonella enterica subsp. salamae]EDV5906641.1 hypothetical protein [Salmonella enterica subsp. salamae]
FSVLSAHEYADVMAVISAGTRKDNVASATARRASRKASNPPGCTIFSVLSAHEYADVMAVITAGARKDNVASATARKASNPPVCVISLGAVFPLS